MKNTLLVSLVITLIMMNCDTNQELTTIKGFPDEIDGCSCYFSRNKEEFDNSEFIYLDTYYQGTAFICIDGQQVKINLDNPETNKYNVKVDFETDTQTGHETWWKTGEITVSTEKGKTLTSPFVGMCGC